MSKLVPPEKFRRIDGLGLFVTVLTLAVYASTLAPSGQFEDDGELAAAAYTLGIAHPTGYPLFTMLGYLVSHLPLGGTVFLRLNAFMALLCAAAAWLFYRTFLAFLTERTLLAGRDAPATRSGGKAEKGGPKRADARAGGVPDFKNRVAAAAAALGLAFSFQFWTNALSLEVYALHLVFVAALLWAFLTAVSALRRDAADAPARWLGFAFLVGLSLANHLMTVLLAPALLYLHFAAHGFGRKAWLLIAKAVPVALLGLTPYLYLPLRAAAKPLMNWSDPATWPDFLAHVTGSQYRYAMYASSEVPVTKLGAFLSGLPRELGFLPFFAVLLGGVVLWRRSPRLLVFGLLLFATCLFYAVNYAFDDPNFYLNAYAAVALFATFGLRALLDRVPSPAFALAVGAAFAAAPLALHYPAVDKSRDYVLEDYARNVLQALEPDALLVTDADSWVALVPYLQWVEGLRTDVVLADRNLLLSRWYWTQLESQHPGLGAGDFDARDPVGTFVQRVAVNRPLYAASLKNATYADGMVPASAGPAFRLYRDPPADLPVPHRNVYRPMPRRTKDSEQIRQFYIAGNVNQGFDRLNRGDTAGALALFRSGLSVDPGHAALRQLLARFEAR